jgi:hypothetical protein
MKTTYDPPPALLGPLGHSIEIAIEAILAVLVFLLSLARTH